jgi:type II secretion system protein G
MKKGFTLIELLVVIAIIALLSSVVLASLSSARAKSRDARRQADLNQVSVALEMFFDSKGRYPDSTDGSCSVATATTPEGGFLPGACLQALISNGYISKLPQDPIAGQGSGVYYYYWYDNYCGNGVNGSTTASISSLQYRLWATGEQYNKGDPVYWWNIKTIGHSNCPRPK